MITPTWHSIIFTCIFILMATGLITLLFSRSTYTRIRAIPYAFVYGLGVVIWLASLVYAQLVANTFLAHRFSFSAAYLVTLGMLGLALTFPNSSLGRGTRRVLALDIFLGSAFTGLIFFTNYVLSAANFASGKTAHFSILGRVYLLLIAVNLIAAIVIFVRRYLIEVRNRLYFNYIVLAFILLFIIGGTTNLILPLTGVVTLALVGPLSALLPFGTIVYALGISDINDISYVVAQLIQVGVRLAILSGLIVTGLLLHTALGIGYYSSPWILTVSIIAGLGAIGLYLFGATFDRYVENKIAYSRLSPDKTRARLVVGLSGKIELDRSANLVLKLVKQSIGVHDAGMVLLAKDDTFWASGELTLARADVPNTLKAIAELPMRHARDQALVNTRILPAAMKHDLEEGGIHALKLIRTESGIAGLYLLGEKFSQEIFTKQDATLMHAITEISDLSIERALFYNQIQSFNATLQQRIDTATLKLRQANQRLKTLDALKDDFISMASHQLRSPATSVHEAIQMMNQGILTPAEHREMIMLAEASSERLVGVVTDMLSMARIQAGHFTVEKESVDMAELVDRALFQASGLAKQKNVIISYTAPKEALKVQADRAKLNESMSNYIENAIKYSPEGATVTVSLKKDGDKIYFEVRDNGIGVPVPERKELFGKFYRATNARHEEPNGNGIGLFVVKTVIEAHGGKAYYQPLDPGSLFGFWLSS